MKTQQAEQFHHVEEWRDQLIDGNDTVLQKFIVDHPQSDRQQLRQLVRNAKNDKANHKNTGGATALFRYLRSILE